MFHCPPEEDLWDRFDRHDPELSSHLETCPRCRSRTDEWDRIGSAVRAVTADGDPALPRRIGPYRVLRRLGDGGMGVVYEAEQARTRRRVALKVVRGDGSLTDEIVRLFSREVETLARLSHPGIAAIHDAGRTEQGAHYFAMELVRGCPIDRQAAEHELDDRERLSLFAQLCGSIAYAHRREP